MSGGAAGASVLQTELGLDEKQTSSIRELDRDLMARLNDQCAQYCMVRSELAAVLQRQDTNAATESRQLVERMCVLQSASEQATLEHIGKVSALLSEAQRKRFLSGLAKCLCGGGEGCGGSCMMDQL